jgi:ferrous iron transport protein B
MTEATIALAGNPNTGKSTIFNILTGSSQHIGNWPGTTVERKEGTLKDNRVPISVVDLPGIYSLAAYSPEEAIARDFIVIARPALVVNVVDVANLERNLYLTVQLMETETPLIIVLNMMDVASERGLSIDTQTLSRHLGDLPVIPAVASRGQGLESLRQMLTALVASLPQSSNGLVRQLDPTGVCCRNPNPPSVVIPDIIHRPRVISAASPASPYQIQRQVELAFARTIVAQPTLISYDQAIEAEISRLRAVIEQVPALTTSCSARWLAIQLLQGDEATLAVVEKAEGGAGVRRILTGSLTRLEQFYDDDIDIIMADYRYSFVNQLVRSVISRRGQMMTLSDKIDRVVTHRYLGIPIFLTIMWVVFKVTTDLTAPFLDWIDRVISGPLTRWVIVSLGIAGLDGTWVESLFVEGIIAGVGGVLVFVPVLMSLYLALALLEDSGYMARAAFVMDRLMNLLGLQGKSFLPMIVGFGCTVPALYATRTLDNEKDRILTGLLVPFMSCGARLPVYILVASIFFPDHTGLVIFGLYLTGIVTALVLGLILKGTLFKGEEEVALLMELPPYHWPNLKTVWFYLWERTAAFIHNAWTIILATSIVIWLLMAMPSGGQITFADTELNESAFAAISRAIAPVFAPLGFGQWEASGALVTGLVAKEVVVSTLAQTYNVVEGEAAMESTMFHDDLTEIGASFVTATADTVKSIPLIIGIDLFDEENETTPSELKVPIRQSFEAASRGHGSLAALAFMVFILLYTPCMATIVAERQVLGRRWMWLSIIGQLALAWLAAWVVFQGGLLLGLG